MGYIMVVDDDSDLAETTAIVLRKEGHETVTYLDVGSAYDSALKRPPDLIILDVMFPDNATGGFELARKIAAKNQSIPILMLTAVNSHFQLDFSAGDIDQEWMPITDFMEKPVDFEVMKKTVAEILAKKNSSSRT